VLIVTDQAGNVGEKSMFVRIEDRTPPMIRVVEEMNVEKNKKVRFDALSCIDNVGIASYEWDFGDGEKAYSAEAYHTYTKDGKYKVTLSVRDVNGLSNTTSIMVSVRSPADYTALYLSICLAAILAAVCSVVGLNLYRKWKLGGFVVENAMLIYSDGRLISQMSIRENEGDSDIIAGMLTAVQSFMEDSFKNQYNLSGRVGKLEWSGKKILIDKREKFTLVLVVDGYDWDKIHRMLKKTADKIENEYKDQLLAWDGNLSDFVGLKALLASMLIKEGEPKREKKAKV
ncbi:MAG: PKD domain-containing protein, partial [Thermoplasmata archaeon]